MNLKQRVRTRILRDLYRGINDFTKGYQTRSKIVKDEKGDLAVDPLSILNMWRTHFSQILNVSGVNGLMMLGR
jgi:hypothetical protein